MIHGIVASGARAGASVLDFNPTIYYHFGEGGAANLGSTSGADLGSITTTNDGGVIALSARAQTANSLTTAAICGTGDITLLAVFKVGAATDSQDWIFAFNDDSGTLAYRTNPTTNKVICYLGTTTYVNPSIGSVTEGDGIYHVFCTTFNSTSGTAKFYQNGAYQSEGYVNPGSIKSATRPIGLLQDDNGSSSAFFADDTLLALAAILPQELTPEQVASLTAGIQADLGI